MNTKTNPKKATPNFCKNILLICLYLAAGPAWTASIDDLSHRQAISQAHDGQYTPALRSLQLLADKHPKPNRYFYDYIATLSWAGEHQTLLSISSEISLNLAPEYVLKALAIAYRQQRQPIKSEQVYRTIIRRFPGVINAKAGLALVLIDQGEFPAAEKLLFAAKKQHPDNLELLKALVYFHEAQQQFIPALSYYQKILAINPTDSVSLGKKILLLNQIGASHLANSLITDASILSDKDRLLIQSNMAAHRIRWSEIPAPQEKAAFNELDRAISEIEGNIHGASASLGATSTLALNGQFDLLVALRNRYRMAEALTLYEELRSAKIAVPTYAQQAACDALLYLEQAADAEACYLQIKTATQQENINLDLSLFYAYLENEQASVARQWVQDIAAKQAPYIFGKGKQALRKPNPKKTQAETIAALSLAYVDDLAEAQQLIESLHLRAPYNTDLRKELANIYYWRGWPRRAQQEYDMGLYQEPQHIGLRSGQARNQLSRKQYDKAQQSIRTLFAQYPDDKGIALQNELWGIDNMREFKTEITSSESSGGVNGSRGLDISSYLYSRPLDKNYRVFIHQRHSQAKFSEGDGLLNHHAIGLEYTAPSVFLMTELHHNHYANDRLGVNINGQYEFDDHLSTSFALESLSGATPLRGLKQGIYAKSVALGGQYRWHESRSSGLNIAYLNFSDGNQRKSINGYWQERWYNRYAYKFSTRIDLYASDNSKANTIYFNPESDFSSSIAFENDWLSWRKYEDSFHQRIILSTGFYNQKGFSAGNTWGLQYEHRWTARHRLELLYGVKRASNLYDGDDELSWSYYLSLDWRF